jgi:hypothetical protein
MNKIFITSFFLFLVSLCFVFSPHTLAKIGVGVGTGKIQVEDELKGGMIYQLPPLTVLNTGDEPADYEVSVSYHQNQPELKPPGEWFSFQPNRFHLEAGEVQTIEINLNLPVRTEPGDYLAYLEGHPLKKSEAGQTTIGVAAAAKLYFTVAPANFLQAIYYRLTTFWRIYSPWTNILAVLALGLAVLFVFKRFFKIQFGLSRKKKTSKDKDE